MLREGLLSSSQTGLCRIFASRALVSLTQKSVTSSLMLVAPAADRIASTQSEGPMIAGPPETGSRPRMRIPPRTSIPESPWIGADGASRYSPVRVVRMSPSGRISICVETLHLTPGSNGGGFATSLSAAAARKSDSDLNPEERLR
jgi:hypothetical protein